MSESKAQLRIKLLAARQGLSIATAELHSELAAKHLLAALDFDRIKTVHIYLPIRKKGEVDSMLVLRHIWQEHPGVATFTSVVLPASREMLAVPVRPETPLVENLMGIPEPLGEQSVKDMKFDLVIVPLVGFDERCNRLGYGKGDYDQFLATQPQAILAGLGYELSKVDAVPVEPHDIPLTLVATEARVYRS